MKAPVSLSPRNLRWPILFALGGALLGGISSATLFAAPRAQAPLAPQTRVALQVAPPAAPSKLTLYSDEQLLDQVQERAWRFFAEKSDPTTGLTQDRAALDGSDNFDIASIAATGYSLAALPVAAEHGWLSKDEAQAQALKTLRFAATMPTEHGFFYHFVNKSSGAREWNSEASSIDTGLLLCGAILCGEYFGGEVKQLADQFYDRADWQWLLTNGGAMPGKLRLSHGWKPEDKFLPYDYGFSEAALIYLLAIGSKTHPIPAKSWEAMGQPVIEYQGLKTIAGGPIFIQQMPQNFYPMKGKRDKLGFDYWVSATNSIKINRLYCIDKMGEYRTYGPNFWGLNAGDAPDGYKAFGAPNGPDDGTISPTGVLGSMPFTPELALQSSQEIYRVYGDKLWGRYGFGNAYNVDRNWFGDQVIGIDLGMALLAIENYRNGLGWKLMEKHPSTKRAYDAIGLRATTEAEPRALLVAP